ncbi:MAG: protein translocase subunit SecD [Defluviitaleaceae bacterium]|nr:protein translocase subunit SecD [Defluviitaleaceae bacterium]MCL2262865.1 protein translocase subunit SecD [Defluviitaleaceae bacterium]
MKGKSALTLVLILIATAGLIALNALGIPAFGEGRYDADGNRRHVWGVGNIRQGLDLMGGVSILYEADIDGTPAAVDMNAAQALLRGRLDRRGYTEADVAQEGARQLRVDIPGVEDAEAAVAEIGATAMLTFRGCVNLEEGNAHICGSVGCIPSERILLTGANVDRAFRQVYPELGVSLSFDSIGTQLFEDATRANRGHSIAIFMDDELISNPVVNVVISDGNAIISGGNMTMDSALLLAQQIEQGSLPFGLEVVSMNLIGARLGADALRTSIIAGAIGLFLVLLFMAVFYRTMGLCADLALVIYVGIVLFIISALGITLSLPGIAGLILSIGMATDANIVIFERIREEVAMGKTLRSAMRTGYRRAWPAIVDSNVTTLIAGGVLFWLGTGPIMGFAQMLIIGILVSMLTCLVVTRIITVCLMDLGLVKQSHIISAKQQAALDAAKAEGKSEPEQDIDVKPIVEKRKIYFGFSVAVLAVGLAFMLGHGIFGNGFFNLDVEFSGGTSFMVDIGQDFDNRDIEEIVRNVTGESAPQVQQILGTNEVMIRTTTAQDEADTRIALIRELSERYNLNPDEIQYSFVSPAVSAAMRRSAVLAIVIASIGMLLYISIRFRDVRTGASAVLAQLHDALVVLGIYAVLRIPLNYAFIAVMLTTLGYSINATIIIFDRIRENRVRMPKAPYDVLINTSVTQTLRRTLFSTLSSFMAVFMLYVIGVAAIRDFTLPIMVGLLFGAYSSVCLSGSAWYMMLKKDKVK